MMPENADRAKPLLYYDVCGVWSVCVREGVCVW